MMKWLLLPAVLGVALVVAFTQGKPLDPPARDPIPVQELTPAADPVSTPKPVLASEPVVTKEPVPVKTLIGPSSGVGYRSQAPEPSVKTGHFVLVNKSLNVLWHYQSGELVEAYRVATGRDTTGPAPTWTDYATNFVTPEGTFRLTNFVVEPSYSALKPGDKSYAGGAAGNPLGTRWMGFTVLDNDRAWVWGIHGTSEPEKIGGAVSDGCIRMLTAEAEVLFDQLAGKNAVLQVVGQ